MRSLGSMNDLGFDIGTTLIPGASIVSGVLDIFKAKTEAQAAQDVIAAQTAAAQSQAEAQQQAAVQQMIQQQVRGHTYANWAMAAGAVALFGAAGYLAWKAMRRK